MSTAIEEGHRTKVDGQLAAAQQRHANDPERAELIGRARRFKASWIELAEALCKCQKRQAYTRWGYPSFEDYYLKELRLKTATVNKLVGTYVFLRDSAPEVLTRDGVIHEFPAIKNIDFLRRAEEAADQGEVAPDLLADLRDCILEDNMPPGKVAKRFQSVLFPENPEVEARQRRRALNHHAELLLMELKNVELDDVPEIVVRQVRVALERFVDTIHQQPSAVAA